eukprot:3938967-Rhodomonas_salina.2
MIGCKTRVPACSRPESRLEAEEHRKRVKSEARAAAAAVAAEPQPELEPADYEEEYGKQCDAALLEFRAFAKAIK